MATENQTVSDLSPIAKSLLEWAEYWYPISWKGVLVGGVITAIGACATIAFLLLQWQTTSTREEHSEWRTSVLEFQTATAKADLGKAQADIARATEGAAKANERAAEANARTKEAELRLAELREKVARPRQLNQAVFSEEIKGIPAVPVEITLRASDPDSDWLAFSLMGALEKAGWPVVQSGSAYQLFGQTPEPIKACAGNFGGIRVLSKRLSEQDIANLQAPPPRPKGTSPLIGLSDVLWKAVGENEAGFATCPYLPEGQLHIVVAPRWVILPQIAPAPASAEPKNAESKGSK